MKLSDKKRKELQRRRWDYDNVLIPSILKQNGNPAAFKRPGSLK